MTARDRQRRRAESRELAWMAMREADRARYLPREMIRVEIVVMPSDENEPAFELEKKP